ncbi:MAG: hypothetical protein AAF430_13325 [Myxococcota bacterium]
MSAIPEWWRVGLAIGWVVGAFGCARPYPVYDGPTRPDSELAFFDAAEPCKVLKIDGREVPHLENWFALEPGKHWVMFRVRRQFRNEQASTNCLAYLDMQAGHTYTVQSRFDKKFSEHRESDIFFQVTLMVDLLNTTTGEIIEDVVCE